MYADIRIYIMFTWPDGSAVVPQESHTRACEFNIQSSPVGFNEPAGSDEQTQLMKTAISQVKNIHGK